MGRAAPQPEPADARSGDAAVIDLLRLREAQGIGELAEGLGVTATAVRQRLDRLMRAGFVARSTVARPRGRPAHAYRLTEKGRKSGGDNFRDLALVLWREVRGIRDPAVRSGLMGRIGKALAETYRERITGGTAAERLESVASVLRDRDVCCSVEASGSAGLPVLTSHACPYPDLAEEDRGICSAERLMLQDLVGSGVRLAECRLDGGSVCRFVAGERAGAPADGGSCTSDGERVECPSVSPLSQGRGVAPIHPPRSPQR